MKKATSYNRPRPTSSPAKKTSTKRSKAKYSGNSSPSNINVHVDKDSSMSIRKIENGFIVRESGTEGKGKNKTWYEKEYFTPNNPVKLEGAKSKGRMGSKK